MRQALVLAPALLLALATPSLAVIAAGGGNVAQTPPPAEQNAPAQPEAAPPAGAPGAPEAPQAPPRIEERADTAATTTPAPKVASDTAVPVRLGTSAVLLIRLPYDGQSIQQRAQVVQSRLDQVLVHHPELSAGDVGVTRDGVTPVVVWGRFPIVSVDAAHARVDHYSSPDLLAAAWADSLRKAIQHFEAGRKMPPRALYHDHNGSDFVYRRTDNAVGPQGLKDTGFVFSSADLVWGVGVKPAGQGGFAVFVRQDAGDPPAAIFLGNPQHRFTEYDRITAEDQP
ncbi:MAG TPA: hypothetical protein V6D47_10965 [Oscillatoriaceae cyanobacterium]